MQFKKQGVPLKFYKKSPFVFTEPQCLHRFTNQLGKEVDRVFSASPKIFRKRKATKTVGQGGPDVEIALFLKAQNEFILFLAETRSQYATRYGRFQFGYQPLQKVIVELH